MPHAPGPKEIAQRAMREAAYAQQQTKEHPERVKVAKAALGASPAKSRPSRRKK